jgi:hypothetical protein
MLKKQLTVRADGSKTDNDTKVEGAVIRKREEEET